MHDHGHDRTATINLSDQVAFADSDELYASGMLPADVPPAAAVQLFDYCQRHDLVLRPGAAEAMVTSYAGQEYWRITCSPRAYCRLARRTRCYRPGRIWFESLEQHQTAFASCSYRDDSGDPHWSELSSFAVFDYHYERTLAPDQAQPLAAAEATGLWRRVPLEMLALVAELRACKRAVEHHPEMREHQCDDDGLAVLVCAG
jgi:hypothetical protein